MYIIHSQSDCVLNAHHLFVSYCVLNAHHLFTV